MNTKSPLFEKLDWKLKEAFANVSSDYAFLSTDESVDTRIKLILGILKYHEEILLTSPFDLKDFSAPVVPVIIPGFGYLQLFTQEYGSTSMSFQLTYCDRFCFVAPFAGRHDEEIPSIKELKDYLVGVMNREPMNKAKLVVKLRDITGSSMMECKLALQHVGWNIVRAQDYLRHAGTGKLTDTFSKQY